MKTKTKIWGMTTEIAKHPVFSVHYIQVMPHTFCSVHRHAHRVNLFYVLSGELIVRMWSAADGVRDVQLRVGDTLEVPAGVYHQFRCVTGADVIEIYYPILPNDDDIERISEGGTFAQEKGVTT